MYEFEMGPIRPPSEAGSILIRLTRNCPWNKCAFCPVYKNEKFSLRSKEEVLRDIDSIWQITELLKKKNMDLGFGVDDFKNISLACDELLSEGSIPEMHARQVAFWLFYGMKSIFLQDADSLVVKTTDLVEILTHAKDKFPMIERITSYARAKTVSRKSPDELKDLREAGLNRIHIGMESGSDRVLEMINKGVTREEQIKAGRNIMRAGFELSEYYMPGAGGREYIEENARESAQVINEINPTFVRIRSVIPAPGTPLYQLMMEKKWTYPTEEEKIKEIRLFIENLGGISSIIVSDHIMNLIEDIEGTLPEDREKMLGKIDGFLSMNDEDRKSYIIGRRLGRYRSPADYAYNPDIEKIKNRIEQNHYSVDAAVLELLWNYI